MSDGDLEILHFVLYGCETCTLREEHRMRGFENRLLRRIFGPKRDEVTGEWKRLRNEELNSSPNIFGNQIKKNEMGRACSVYGCRRCA